MKINRTIGFWILISVGILLNLIYLLGQTMVVINYNFTVSLGLQEHVNEITEIGVALNRGFGLGDTLLYIPLFIIGIIGIFWRSERGLYAMFAAMGITVYWPIVCLSTVFFAKSASAWHFTNYISYSILLSLP